MIYTIESLAEKLATTESDILAMVRDDNFPSPVFVANRIMRWLESDVFEWIDGHDRFLEQPGVFEIQFAQMRNELRREFLEKHLAEEELNRAAVASCTSTADKCTDADAVACCQCNKTN